MIEPLDEHIEHYERMLTSNLGLGVQAVYRGLRLYDTPRVRERVQHLRLPEKTIRDRIRRNRHNFDFCCPFD